MKGSELKAWRTVNSMTQVALMAELGITSRQTLHNWESSEFIPRVVELAITALDQIEACRLVSVYKSQFSETSIAKRRHELWKKNDIFGVFT